jgi:hypothetical protein
MAQTDLVCSKCVGRRTVNNIMMKVNSKVIVTVPPGRPLAYTERAFYKFYGSLPLEQHRLYREVNPPLRTDKLLKYGA